MSGSQVLQAGGEVHCVTRLGLHGGQCLIGGLRGGLLGRAPFAQGGVAGLGLTPPGKGGGLTDPVMVSTLMFGFLSFTLFTIVLLWSRYRIDLSSSRLANLEQEALELGIGED